MKIAPIDLGCPKNTVDLEKVLGLLAVPGLRIVEDPCRADVVIINTCAFIRPAVEEALETILETARLKGQGTRRIVVTGCLPQRFGKELAGLLPEAELVVTARDPTRMAARIRGFLGLRAAGHSRARWSLTPSHYAYLKIAEGCDNCCAYCTIPLIKGRYRSRPAEVVLAEARELARRGAQELIVVAQDTTLYGAEGGKPSALPELLRALAQVEGPRWIRLMYTHPAHVDEPLIATIASQERICKYIDLPVQHGSDRILAAMGRKTTRAQLEQLVHRIRQQIPSVAIRSTVMVGFPGETEADFELLLDFLEAVRFDHLGVFTYWPEEETRAAAMAGQVAEEEKNARHAQVLDLQSRISSARTAGLLGRTVLVLVDEVDKTLGISWGRTEWDAPEVDSRVRIDDILEPGHFATVRITGSDGFDLHATPAGSSSTSAAAGEGAELSVPREVSRV
ncbi:MAG: 30S ribosomal protein S12 methylthiotransferase RimO [Calditrichaeota bacterium]|nr:30S ribosomal protein S12 methylthiotransferase RimO [Calditrichota bacterium]